MKVLLREIQKGADGTEERRDSVFEGERLGIGGAPGQAIQLLGIPARYATLTLDGSALRLTYAQRKAGTGTLQAGDTLTIEGHDLRLVAPPAGFHAAVEIRRNLDLPPAAFERAFTTELSQTRWSKRLTTWVLVAMVLVVGLVLPLLLRKPAATGEVAASQEATGAVLSSAGQRLPFSDSFWSSGPLSSAHRTATANNCSACHTRPFTRVQDTACASCHKDMADHVASARRTELGLDVPARCASCHHEHDEPQSHLVAASDSQCASCHGGGGGVMQKANLKPATDFSVDHHPQFSARLPRPPDDTNPDWSFIRVSLEGATETPNLKFSHQQHLTDSSVVRPSDGAPLQCVDCHKATIDGEHFEPVTMAQNCSGCHSLAFDRSEPDRQLPHGKGRLQEVILTLQDHFVRTAIDPTARTPAREKRRLPGQAPQIEIDPVCGAATVACGKARAENAVRQHFGEKGCGSCHVITENAAAANIVDRYSVAPVRLVYDYQTVSSFSHRQHRQMGDQGGDAACQSCHKVGTSEVSSELHLPDIKRCTECHGGRNAVGRIRSTCMGCHSYHPDAH